MKKLGIKKLDIIIIIALLLVGAIMFFALNFLSSNGNMVIIQVDDTVVESLPLDRNIEYSLDNTNKIVIKDGQAFMQYANCPDKICVHHKPISNNNESIVCLPNKVVVTVSSNDTEIDGVAR